MERDTGGGCLKEEEMGDTGDGKAQGRDQGW